MSFGATMIVILSGLDVTLRVTLYSLLYGLPFALLFGALQYRAGSWRRWIVTAIIEFWRSSSVVILLFFFFYVLPAFDLKLSAMSVSSLVLGINIGAYGSQVVRGALQSVERGQIEAGLSLGLPRLKVLLLVEFPQAVRLMIPTFINETIQLTKETALVSLVTLSDMTFKAKEVSQLHYQPVQVYTALLCAYFLVCYPIAFLGRRVERKLNAVGGFSRAF